MSRGEWVLLWFSLVMLIVAVALRPLWDAPGAH